MANVIPLPRRDILRALPREKYLVRHEEKTDVCLPQSVGRRVVTVKKSFFDGYNRVEFAIEKEVENNENFEAVLADLEMAVNRFFAS